MRKNSAKTIDERLQRLLADIRAERNLTQDKVADKLGKPQSYVSKYENGARKLTLGDFLIVCRALKVNPADLINELT